MSFSNSPEKSCVQVTGGTGAIVAGSNFGVASSLRNSAGDYTVVTNRSYSFPIITPTILSATPGLSIGIAPNADKVTFHVTIWVGTTPTDANFSLGFDEAIT